MTGETMRPDQHWTTLSWSIWAVLFLTLKADNEECTIELQVRRSTIYKASLGQQLRIDCPVVFCNNPPPPVSWYKIEEKHVRLNVNNNSHIKIGWKMSNPLEGTSYLLFQNIVRNDLGTYQCESGGSVGHAINITVNGATHVANNSNNSNSKKITNNTNQTNIEPTDTFLMYMYSAAGIVAFVIIVIIISVISMQGCKGKSRKEKQTENQYMEIPLAVQAIPNAPGLQHSPRGSPHPLPSRRASERKTPGQPVGLIISRDNEQFYGQRTQDKNRHRNATQMEEPGSVVYAALNHGLQPREAPRPQVQIEETEYAAIRLG
ncbi:hypothetical protein CHARACLAT_018408 [Characodon lateralis]|uniref:Ig-like domain-containing protein n=1 Tax=Characodon lateralis TaxID=208331 RepID=A0ABU7D7U7_9TELE|nr:hypothetical protein [Characodon lateralis]